MDKSENLDSTIQTENLNNSSSAVQSASLEAKLINKIKSICENTDFGLLKNFNTVSYSVYNIPFYSNKSCDKLDDELSQIYEVNRLAEFNFSFNKICIFRTRNKN